MKKFLKAGAVLLAVLLAAFPSLSAEAVRGALALLARVMIPSLFPFFVCANFLTESGAGEGRWLEKASHFLFRVRGGAAAVLLGLVSGYPAGAAVTCSLFQNGRISRGEAERLLAFTNNAGPLFVIGVIGTEVYQNTQIGYILWISQTLSALLTGLCMRFYGGEAHGGSFAPIQKRGESVVQSAVSTMLLLCGFILFFSVIVAFLEKAGVLDFFCRLLVALGFSERTAILCTRSFLDIAMAAESGGGALPAMAALLSFGGLSVFFQTASVVHGAGLSMRSYFLGKFLSAGFSALFCRIALSIFPAALAASAVYVKTAAYSGYLTAALFLSAGAYVLLGRFRK